MSTGGGYLFKDGVWSFFVVESLFNNKGNKWNKYVWVDKFDNRKLCELLGLEYNTVSLGSAGIIWRELGMSGTVSLDYAKILLNLCRKEFPKHGHRIVKRTVSHEIKILTL